MSVTLKCPNGHCWQSTPDPASSSTTDSLPCPVCGVSTGWPDATTRAPTGESEEETVAGAIVGAELDEPLTTPGVEPEIPKTYAFPGYRILGTLGQGGMGLVYKAHDLKLDRTVALKVMTIAPQQDTLRRFRDEARSLARLKHPNIAQVYDVGEQYGRPFITMEYVEGGPLTRRMRDTSYSPAEAARLVESLAHVVHFSHEQGIVHRDLKPSNILLARDDAPKIVDFGLAKWTHSDSQATRTGEVMGTPGYMAPEQARGASPDVGPACDIHALGAILYELLAGRPPYRGEDAVHTLLLVATHEPTPLRRLQPRVPRDLETICLKCLRKSPSSRYESARALADDLHRFLEHQPIKARPISAPERFAKWCRRRPVAATFSALAILAPLISVAALLFHNQRLELELHNTERERQRATTNLADAQEAVEQMLMDIGYDRLAPLAGSEPVRREMLEFALQLCQRLKVNNPSNTDLMWQTARAERQVGDIYQLLGRFDDSREAYEKAIQHFTVLAQIDSNMRLVRDLASAHNNLGTLMEVTGRLAEAEQAYRAAIDKFAAVKPHKSQGLSEAEMQRVLAAAHSNLGVVLQKRGQFDEAESAHDTALSIRRRLTETESRSPAARYALAVSLNNLGTLYRDDGRTESARQSFQQAFRLFAGLHQDNEDDPKYREALASSGNNLGATLLSLQQTERAENAYRGSIDEFQRLADDYPLTLEYQRHLAESEVNLGLLLGQTRKTDEAVDMLHAAVNRFERLTSNTSNNPAYRQGLALGLHAYATSLGDANQWTLAEQSLRRCLELQETLVQEMPDQPEFLSQLAQTRQTAAEMLARRNEFGDARHYLELACDAQQDALEAAPNHIVYRVKLRDQYVQLAELLIQMDEVSEAVAVADRLSGLCPRDGEEQILPAALLARCIPLASTSTKGTQSADGEKLADYCTRRSLELLRQAIANGAIAPSELEQSEAFSALRSLSEFKELMIVK